MAYLKPPALTRHVRNLRAAGAGELSRNGHAQSFTATEVPPEQREAIIARCREVAGHSVDRYFGHMPAPVDHPVFQVVRVGQVH